MTARHDRVTEGMESVRRIPGWRRGSSWIAAGVTASVLACSVVHAADLSLQSQPRSVHLQFQGPVNIEGVTPLTVQQLPPGEYLLRASGLGLVTARGRWRSRFDEGVTLERWASGWALFLPPGFVHLARHEGWRGAIFTTAAAGGVFGAIVKSGHLDTARNDRQLAQDAYDQATTPAEITAARLQLESASEREDDEAHMRNIWTGFAAGAWVGAAVETWALTSKPSLQVNAQGSYVVGVRRGRAYDAALRSALVPGAGQRHMGHRWRAFAFGASFWGLAAGSIASYDEYLQAQRRQSDAQRRYDAANTPAEIDAARADLNAAADQADEWQVRVWTLLGSTGAAYLWNVLDAAGLGASGWTRSAVDVSVAPGQGGVVASLHWRLP